MRHKWGEPDWFMDKVFSQCKVCGGFRIRKRVAHVDYGNGDNFHWDGVGSTRKGWRYDEDTPRSCPGEPIDFDALHEKEVDGG